MRTRLAGTSLLALVAIVFPSAHASSPVGVQNGRLACGGVRNGNGDVFAINPDGSGLRWLTENDVPDGDPAWSPDGKRLAFTSSRQLGSEVYVMNADGSHVRMLTKNGSAPDTATTWSPDGRRIVFQSARDGDFEVYSMNADGSNQQNLSHSPTSSDALPAISPDGTKIAFNSDRAGADPASDGIYVMNVDGSDVRKVTTVPDQNAGPAWSPDGKQLVFHSGVPLVPGGLGIYRINLDGTGLTRLTPLGHDRFDAFPVWSPDGKRIAWTSNRDPENDYEVFTMNASDGGSVQQVTHQRGLDVRCSWDRRR